MTIDPPPSTPTFDLQAELARIDRDRERLYAWAGQSTEPPSLWWPIFIVSLAGAVFFAAGMAFACFFLR